ncbi:UNVERIFIED_CONTAM: hypothetical protein RMT77_003290 [Armadillidium vulgare]
MSNCTCGRKFEGKFLVSGGVEVEKAEFPWHVALYHGDRYFCGGTIINNLYVLTAAHCFKEFFKKGIMTKPTTNISIVLGGHELGKLSKFIKKKPNADIRHVQYVLNHEDFDQISFSNDISLIKLKEPIKRYTHEIVPICLPPLDQSFEDEEVIVCGWGALREKGGPSKVLRKTTVKILSNSECGRKLRHFYKNDFMICAALPGSDACQGDSGGPLMLRLNMYQYTQVGVVSFGIGCGDQDKPRCLFETN